MADITMPQLGETVTEGTITRWAKQVGDKIDEDEVLFEVSTDKVDSEVPSPTSGYLTEILVQEGETVDVGARLAVISADAPAGNGSAAPSAPAPAPTPAQDDTAMEQEEAKQAGEPEPAMQEEPAPEQKEPERRQPAATRPPDSRPSSRPSDGGGSSKVLSPVVRRLIAEHDL